MTTPDDTEDPSESGDTNKERIGMNFVDLVTGLTVGLMLITAYEAETKVRLIVIALGVLSFALPAAWRVPAMDTIAFLARVFIALGCYLYLRSRRKMR